MTAEQYILVHNAFDDMLTWAIYANDNKRNQLEWNTAKARRLEEEFEKRGIKVLFIQSQDKPECLLKLNEVCPKKEKDSQDDTEATQIMSDIG
jgi:hypothetical protein